MPYVTYTLLFFNVLVHLSTLHYSEAELFDFQRRWGITLADPSMIGLFTHGFIHADWMHLAGNMLILWIVGTVLEAGIGSALFFLLYFTSLIGAVFLQGIIGRIFLPESLSIHLIGASGAIAGITGFAAFRYYHIRVLNFIVVPNLLRMPAWLPVIPLPVPFWMPFWSYAVYFGGRELLFGIVKLQDGTSGGVAHWAHLGGMTLGLLAGLMLQSFQEGKREMALETSAKVASGDVPKQRSLDELHRLLRQQPDDPELLAAMAGLAMANGDTEESRTLYLKAIPIFLRRGQMDHAAVNYMNLRQVFSGVVFALRDQMALASVLESLGHYEEAAQAFALVAEHYSQHEEAQTALLRAAQIHQKQLQAVPTAAHLLAELIERYPESPWHALAQDRLQEIQRKSTA